MFPTEKDYALARVMLTHSLSIKPKEKVLITVSQAALPLAKAVYEETLKLGAYPLLDIDAEGTSELFYRYGNDWQIGYVPSELIKAKIGWADAYVRIVAEENSRELASADPAKMAARAKLIRPLMDPMIDSDRWILTYYPTPGMAQEAAMSHRELSDFYYDACLVDYKAMQTELKGLEKLMDTGKQIHVVGKMTDLYVNIE